MFSFDSVVSVCVGSASSYVFISVLVDAVKMVTAADSNILFLRRIASSYSAQLP